MNKKMKINNDLKKILFEQADDEVDAAVNEAEAETPQTSTATDTFTTISKGILPILLGLSSVSMLCGKGLFGLGKNNMFGGWFGQSIGGIGALALLPSLWSKEDFFTRMGKVVKFAGNQDWENFFKALAGMSTPADRELKKGKNKLSSSEHQEQVLKQRLQNYIDNSKRQSEIIASLTNDGYKIHGSTSLGEDITLFMITPFLDAEKKRFGTAPVLGLIIRTDKGSQAFMCTVKQLSKLVSSNYVNSLRISFTGTETAQAKHLSDYNKHMQEDLTKGLNALQVLQNESASTEDWFNAAKLIAEAMLSLSKNSLAYLKNLYGNFKNIIPSSSEVADTNKGYPLETLIKEQTETNTDEIANTFSNDESLKDMKDDPVLNKFDKKLQDLNKTAANEFINTLYTSAIAANEEDPTIFIIEAKQGDKTYYYARDPKNNYLTDKFENTVYFTKEQVQKFEGSGSLIEKFEHTLELIHLPQVMKMKNSGLQVYVEPINLKYTEKLYKLLTDEFEVKF